jgi:RNA polymerase sigma-70 factor, ECF subfamily
MRKRGGKTVTLGELNPIVPRLDRGALDELFSLTYEELRAVAAKVKSGDGGNTLNPTALVHEAWLKLANSPAFATTSRLHFKRIAARAMRQLLVESARRRGAQKRGGNLAIQVTLDDALQVGTDCGQEILRLDDALKRLAQLNPRQAEMVESRFFGGLDVGETAELLQVSEATVLRDWRAARAWLAHAIREAR